MKNPFNKGSVEALVFEAWASAYANLAKLRFEQKRVSGQLDKVREAADAVTDAEIELEACRITLDMVVDSMKLTAKYCRFVPQAQADTSYTSNGIGEYFAQDSPSKDGIATVVIDGGIFDGIPIPAGAKLLYESKPGKPTIQRLVDESMSIDFLIDPKLLALAVDLLSDSQRKSALYVAAIECCKRLKDA
jgi:hypothetical protein